MRNKVIKKEIKNYQGISNNIRKFQNSKIKHRKVDYIKRGNKGRPRKTDFINLKIKDLLDYELMERFELGFETNYIKKSNYKKSLTP